MIAPHGTIIVPLGAQESRWRLVRKDPSGKTGHHIDFRFFVEYEDLCGALLCAGEGKLEIPLAEVHFDGSVLSFRMQSFKDLKSKEIIASPNKVVLRIINNDCFEGQHISPEGSPANDVWLRLIRV